ncbi:MAG: alpha-L-glutamate ligase-like protein [Bdellovibrionales bacterium]|nr:alpha-L-glutamate ligase-like protein [Bdellovibrionales bacterium]
MKPLFAWPWSLRKAGILGMNERNVRLIGEKNRRKNYRFADNKFITKQLAAKVGIPTPELYGKVRFIGDLKYLGQMLEPYSEFVLKPCRGSGGNGVLVVAERDGEKFVTVSGKTLSLEDLKQHSAKILHGLFSLGGKPDWMLIEYRVKFSNVLSALSYQGVPDFRLIVFQGTPVLAMGRFPTSHSKGRANLHQGAVGVGIDIETGITYGGVLGSRRISEHPDTSAKLAEVQIPEWGRIKEIASSCFELTQLGYLGADLVLDEELGPLLLEINVRPGLAIQLANNFGLKKALRQRGYLG